MYVRSKMNFNYSYRAFIITSLLCGCLVLILYSIRLRGFIIPDDTATYDVEILPIEVPQEQEPDFISENFTEIETNKAFNQSEQERAEISRQSRKLTEATEGKLEELNEALRHTQESNSALKKLNIPARLDPPDKNFSNAKNENETVAVNAGGNRKTNIFYNLPGREALRLPNPVYTCAASGTVVVNVEVDSKGMVQKSSYNRAASTTTNECLIDAAKAYSSHAIFTTMASKPKQIGTITFVFPGQD